MSNDYAEMLKIALEAANRATEIHRERARSGFTVSSKSAHHDKVTDADYFAEEAIVHTIRTKFPDHNILAEEGSYSRSSSPFQWIIDPLDGTLNFSRGIPVHSVSIALVEGEELVVGVVADSFRQETFVAIRGGGAFLNGDRIFTSKISRYEDAILISGFFPEDRKKTEENLRTIGLFFDHDIMSVRRFGSAALDLCYVACGRVDGFWEASLKPWDFAAGSLIIQEAGGIVTDNQGAHLQIEPGHVVASNGPFHQQMLDIIGAGQETTSFH